MSTAAAASVTLVITTVPDAEVGERIVETLVEERLIACGTLLAPGTSIYRWDGAVQRAEEIVVLIKTTPAAVSALRSRLHELHPYEVPEVLEFDVGHPAPKYLEWVATQVRS